MPDDDVMASNASDGLIDTKLTGGTSAFYTKLLKHTALLWDIIGKKIRMRTVGLHKSGSIEYNFLKLPKSSVQTIIYKYRNREMSSQPAAQEGDSEMKVFWGVLYQPGLTIVAFGGKRGKLAKLRTLVHSCGIIQFKGNQILRNVYKI